ncbi:uncharacterized protein LOC143594944 [Bidens hawaiensis]|uniref:uncharacterized protein LOC143594944 n=1 Tax=Bidens hawaiensis TaxID=980011 RepID=UPI00404AEF05
MGFSGEVAEPLGSLTLPLTLKDGDRARIVHLRFFVVRAPSKYNIILGRLGINALRAVASTVHEANNRSKNNRKNVEEWILNGEYPEQTIKIGAQLSDKGKAGLKEMLRSTYVFAWKHEDMIGVPRSQVEHDLKEFQWTEHIKQKKRSLGLERSRVVLEETQKLLQVGIVREVRYPQWISSPVMIPKSDNSWRMCIDFKDLNKARPMDSYPLLEIEKKIESRFQFPLRCFLDAYKGYHQIQMNLKDEEKTAFYTNEGTFCYTKIPFGLKNV